MTNPNDDFEEFRGDLIAYLARKLNLSHDDAMAQLGDLLVEHLEGALDDDREQDSESAPGSSRDHAVPTRCLGLEQGEVGGPQQGLGRRAG